MNYFELFGLPMSPVVDRKLLSEKYVELQKKFHPDFFTDGNEAEQEQALQQSAAVNKAYKIFQQPEKTIEYFLQERGIIQTDEKYGLPPDFLMEMMELNEELMEDNQEATLQKVSDYENRLKAAVEPVLQQYDPVNTSDTDLQELKAYYYKKKYLKRILDRLND
jgi:molecular chaperone HscB